MLPNGIKKNLGKVESLITAALVIVKCKCKHGTMPALTDYDYFQILLVKLSLESS